MIQNKCHLQIQNQLMNSADSQLCARPMVTHHPWPTAALLSKPSYKWFNKTCAHLKTHYCQPLIQIHKDFRSYWFWKFVDLKSQLFLNLSPLEKYLLSRICSQFCPSCLKVCPFVSKLCPWKNGKKDLKKGTLQPPSFPCILLMNVLSKIE